MRAVNRTGFTGLEGRNPSGPLAIPEWFKFTVTHTQLQAAALTNDIEIYSLPPGCIIQGAKVKHTTAFAGTGITEYYLSLGVTGNIQSLLPNWDVFQATSDDTMAVQDNFDTYNQGAATSIRVGAESVGANLDQSTAGEACIWFLVSKAV